ncbi:protein trichome birefringence-like 23 [Elaeis guineensis]|uniref:Protein trichome birefringence-like 23 n=1 Tax=Elaeis guineensis var. tenera TaxID=51953 RepID=A0A6I9QUV2_ELAGV|nr:protein trichome birefringence-like 23 [Elaeis guineensis]
MVKEMGSDWEPWPALHRKSNHLLFKLLVSALFIGISFRLFFSHSTTFLPVSQPPAASERTEAPVVDAGDTKPEKDSPSIEKTGASDLSVSEMASDLEEQVSQKEKKCDLFTGEWIPNPSGPAYNNETCHFIEPPQNCMKNGRPDKAYLYWKWRPRGCDLPSFNAEKFLDSMRNKSWALIGDSILRNHVQSLICLLSKAEEAVEVYHDDTYKSRRWRFPSHNFTLSLIWSPFLVKAEIFENDDGESTSEIQLHLDVLDANWTDQYHSFDYIVISAGQWFLKTAVYWENGGVVGCHYCHGKNLTELGVDHAYHKTLQLVFRFVATSDHKPFVLYRTWTPDHFENGEWFNGGTCNRTAPYKLGEYNGKDIDHLMRDIEFEEFDRAVVLDGPGSGARLKLLDTYQLSLLRPDGHSGPYRTFHPFDKDKHAVVQNDCLHWCLPGPVDAWNDLIMEMVRNE